MHVPGKSDGELVLAVDSGGTKTSCTLARIDANRQWTILGTGLTTGGNPRAIGVEAAASAIAQSVRLATAASGHERSPIRRALFAVAGTLHQGIRDDLRQRLSALQLAEQCIVVPDLMPLIAGSDLGISIGLIAGTGSVAIGRDSQGKYAVAGGWGPLLGDDGSGFAIGRAALRATLSDLEAGKSIEGLASQVCEALSAYTSQEMKAVVADAADLRALIASLAPIVLADANRSDPLCQSIVTTAAGDLAELIKTLQSRLQLPTDSMQIALSGGLLQANSGLNEQLSKELTAQGIEAQFTLINDPTIPILNMLVQGNVPDSFEILP
ncbi:BadF/BadG/BcrA/BcrD ATPase family protein [Bremerella sp. JC770]|uniref:BadF/BadG/BcrA/BcrD ATPase family protein n=1 Tax=Bremerella sp. JC770 TaxID=3232137 RepID=UPI0034578694